MGRGWQEYARFGLRKGGSDATSQPQPSVQGKSASRVGPGLTQPTAPAVLSQSPSSGLAGSESDAATTAPPTEVASAGSSTRAVTASGLLLPGTAVLHPGLGCRPERELEGASARAGVRSMDRLRQPQALAGPRRPASRGPCGPAPAGRGGPQRVGRRGGGPWPRRRRGGPPTRPSVGLGRAW